MKSLCPVIDTNLGKIKLKFKVINQTCFRHYVCTWACAMTNEDVYHSIKCIHCFVGYRTDEFLVKYTCNDCWGR